MTDTGTNRAPENIPANRPTNTAPDMASDIVVTKIWASVSERMRQDIGDTAWRSWIKPLVPAEIKQNTLVLLTDNKLLHGRARSQYADRLRLHVRSESAAGLELCDVDIRLGRESSNVAPNMTENRGPNIAPNAAGAMTRQASLSPRAPNIASTSTSASASTSFPPRMSALRDNMPTNIDALGLDRRFVFDSFIVGKPNELAFAAAQRVALSDRAAFNPLFLYSGVGLGKTHLMHAIAWEIRARHPHRKVMYLSAEKFMYQFIRALRDRDTMTFKEQFRSADVLLIDDVQFIADKENTQEEFFHTFNALVEEGRQVVLSADKSPHDLAGIGERLRSRLGWGMVADIHPANYELRLGILQARNEQGPIQAPVKVLEFLAHKITNNIRELEGAYNRITAHAELIGKEITVDMARDTLSDLLRASARRITIEDIQKQVATYFAIRISDMHSARRARNIARPRQIAMYLAKNLTHSSYPEIGRQFGNRDHTTVMHAVKKVEQLVLEDSAFADDVGLLRSMLTDA